MKKFILAILVLGAVFLMACANDTNGESTGEITTITTARESEIVQDEESDLNDSLESSDVQGSRMNPVPFGESFTTEYIRYSYNNETIGYTMKITELLRGEEAMQFALEQNQFNDRDFPENRELILFKIDFTLNKYSADDEVDPQWLASDSSIDYFNGDYSEVSQFVSIAGLESFHAKLYPGGSTSGWCYTTADPSDARPILRHDDRIWFALYNE